MWKSNLREHTILSTLHVLTGYKFLSALQLCLHLEHYHLASEILPMMLNSAEMLVYNSSDRGVVQPVNTDQLYSESSQQSRVIHMGSFTQMSYCSAAGGLPVSAVPLNMTDAVTDLDFDPN